LTSLTFSKSALFGDDVPQCYQK